MAKSHKPEEDLSLSGPIPDAHKDGPIENKAEADEESLGISARMPKIVSAPGASDEDVLRSILSSTEEQLFVWEMCRLPSDGALYGWPDGFIQVRPMTQTAEKALATASLAQSGQSIDYMFRECCRLPLGFDPINLLLGDRMFLIYYIRGITHGNIYEFAIPCPNPECREVSAHTYDLNDLARTIQRFDTSLGKEPFRVSLPHLSGMTGHDVYVSVRFLRGIDGNTMLAKKKAADARSARAVSPNRNPLQAKQERAKRKLIQTVDDGITENLEQVISGVMGNDDPMVIRSVVSKLHAADSAAIREWLRIHTPGIDTTIKISCPECNRDFTVELPITETFFRPQKL